MIKKFYSFHKEKFSSFCFLCQIFFNVRNVCLLDRRTYTLFPRTKITGGENLSYLLILFILSISKKN